MASAAGPRQKGKLQIGSNYICGATHWWDSVRPRQKELAPNREQHHFWSRERLCDQGRMGSSKLGATAILERPNGGTACDPGRKGCSKSGATPILEQGLVGCTVT